MQRLSMASKKERRFGDFEVFSLESTHQNFFLLNLVSLTPRKNCMFAIMYHMVYLSIDPVFVTVVF